MKNSLIFFLIIGFQLHVFSQNQEHISSEENSLPKIVEKGLVLTSSDSLIQMELGLHFQNRITYLEKGDENSLEGEITKVNLKLKGFIYSPKLTYDIETGFSPKYLKTPKDGEPSQVLRTAMITYKPNSNWEFKLGQGKLPGNRQSNNSTSRLQLTDRSINHSRFTIDRDFGFHVYNKNQFEDKFSYNFLTAVSMGEGINWMGNSDAELSYTGKVEVFPLGNFKKDGAYFEGDLEREETPKFMISGGFSQNNHAQRERGQNGKLLFESRTMKSMFADMIFKYQGWAFMSAYIQRTADRPMTYNPENLEDFRYVFVGKGIDFQGSYLFRNNFEITGRFSQQWIDDEIKMYEPNRQQFSLGLTKYIWKHQLKLQAEATYETRDYDSQSEDDLWFIRFQLDFSI